MAHPPSETIAQLRRRSGEAIIGDASTSSWVITLSRM